MWIDNNKSGNVKSDIGIENNNCSLLFNVNERSARLTKNHENFVYLRKN